jgi:PAS domain S-box-containing protein
MSQINRVMTNAKILIVDDELQVQKLLKHFLQRTHYQVRLADTGEQALHEAEHWLPDLILLDIMMPRMDGIETCKHLKQNVLTQNIPIIFLTALYEVGDKLKAFDAGGVDYVTKPVAKQELLARINIHLKLLHTQRELSDSNTRLHNEVKKHQVAEQTLKESQVLFEAIFENTAICIALLDIKGNYVKVNRKCLDLFGYSPAEMQHLSCSQVLHQDFLDNTRAAMLALKSGDKTWYTADKQFIHRQGHYFWGGFWLTPLFSKEGQCTAFICMITDLSERKQVEENLRKLFRAVEQSNNSIVITDKKGLIEYVNPAFCNATGYTQQEVIGRNPRLLQSGLHDYVFYQNLWRTLHQGEAWRGEFTNKRKNGELFNELSTISPVKDEKGDITHFVAVKEDITQLKETERALENAIQTAEQARQAAENANLMKSRFLATMSHEIRTPMNAVIGFAEMLEENISDPQQREYLAIIRNSSTSLLNLINDILDLSKVEAGKLKLEYSRVNLQEILQDVPRLFHLKLQAKGLDFVVDIASSLPAVVMLDEQRCRQILLNLISNAIKFTDAGYIRVIAGYDGSCCGGRLTLSVEDTGSGIPPEQCEAIFQPFEQKAGQSQQRFGGTGLGLSITQRLVELMGGKITLHSEENKGSTFKIDFYNLRIPMFLEPSLYPPEELAGVMFKNLKLVLACALKDECKNIKTGLQNYGFQVYEAKSFKECLSALEHFKPNLLMLDTDLANLDYPLLRANVEKLSISILLFATPGTEQIYPKSACSEIQCAHLQRPVPTLELLHALMCFLPHQLPSGDQKEGRLAQEIPAAIREQLEQEFKPRWQTLTPASPFNELESFGQDIQVFAENYAPLQLWGQKLAVQAANFDIENVFQTLKEFERFVRQQS